jgi:kynurenine formamidase
MTRPVPHLTTADVDAMRSALSNWGRWGDDDQLGTLNHLTDAHRAAAAAGVRTGRAISCARPLPTEPAVDNPRPVEHHMLGTYTEGHGADWFGVAAHGYATSHLDALCHIFWDGQVYGGRSSEVVTAHGAEQLGVHHVRHGLVGRGVLLDIPPRHGVQALEPGTPITVDDLEAAEEAAGVRVGTGDLLLVRTGRWAWRREHGPWDARQRLAGLHASCLPWLHEREVAVLGSDGVSDVHPAHVEASAGVETRLPIHTVGIVAMGLHLLDDLDLDDLAAACAEEGRWSFLLTVAPLVLVGGTASPVNPIAVL